MPGGRITATNSPLLGRLVTALILTAVVCGSFYLFSQQHVYRLSVRPGEVGHVDVDVPMQRFGRSKSFAKALGLPVSCVVSQARDDEPGVRISVLGTEHTLHHLRARLLIEVDPNAHPGKRRRSIDLTIDGQGGWPTATVVVSVGSSR
jgi:hypothetical protein